MLVYLFPLVGFVDKELQSLRHSSGQQSDAWRHLDCRSRPEISEEQCYKPNELRYSTKQRLTLHNPDRLENYLVGLERNRLHSPMKVLLGSCVQPQLISIFIYEKKFLALAFVFIPRSPRTN